MDWIAALLGVFVFAGGHDRLAFWIMLAAVVISLATIIRRLRSGYEHGHWLQQKIVILVVVSAAALWLGARASVF